MSQNLQPSANIEARSPHDTPLTEWDCQVFQQFYFEFLGKTEEDSICLLKALSLMRQRQKRQLIHSLIKERAMAERFFPTMAERLLLLTYPSTLQTIWHHILEYRNTSLGGEAVLDSIRTSVVEYLTQIQGLSKELNDLLKKVQPLQPKEKFTLSIAFASTAELKNRPRSTYQWLGVVLVDKAFLCIMPDNSPSTNAIGKLRTYINQNLGAKADSLYIEFFIVGGGSLKKQSQIQMGGENPIFDIYFDNPNATASQQLLSHYHNAKFALAYEVLSSEFPTEGFAWEPLE